MPDLSRLTQIAVPSDEVDGPRSRRKATRDEHGSEESQGSEKRDDSRVAE